MKFDFSDISFADVRGYSLLKDSGTHRSDAERAERGNPIPGAVGSNAERVERDKDDANAELQIMGINGGSTSDSPPLREVQDFDLSKSVEGVSDKDSDALAQTSLPAKAVLPSKGDFDTRLNLTLIGSETERAKPVAEITDAEKYVDVFLGRSIGKSTKRDAITDFYSDLANSKGVLRYAHTEDLSHNGSEKTLAINKNTADRHGRT